MIHLNLAPLSKLTVRLADDEFFPSPALIYPTAMPPTEFYQSQSTTISVYEAI